MHPFTRFPVWLFPRAYIDGTSPSLAPRECNLWVAAVRITFSACRTIRFIAAFVYQIGRLSEELKHLRKECRSQARKLEQMQHNLETREDKENELRRKVRKEHKLRVAPTTRDLLFVRK